MERGQGGLREDQGGHSRHRGGSFGFGPQVAF
jgi:hypothetical protein